MIGAASGCDRNSATPINFTLPTTYPVEGGVIANGTVTFKYKNGGGSLVTCTYKGGSSSASPATKADINAGRYLNFQSCSDGLPVTTPRTGNHFEISVTPAPGLPVTVNTPVRADGACSDKMEIMSAQTTTQLHDSFNWASATKLPATNSDGSPTLYNAWVYIRSKDDAIKLRQ